MRVIVCGGRTYGDIYVIESTLRKQLPADAVLVHGGAHGADELAHWIWEQSGGQTEVHFADWAKYKNAAGPIRNQEMLDAGADLVIAFPGGKGTADMVRRADKAGIPVRKIGF